MKWIKDSKWHLESEDKRYMVTKYIVNGKSVYQAIRKPDVSLLIAGSADEYKAACEGGFQVGLDHLRARAKLWPSAVRRALEAEA